MTNMKLNPDKKGLRIAHTVWPNGHKCIWSKVDVNKLFYWCTNGNFWFAWARICKTKTEDK